jgi:putative transposase
LVNVALATRHSGRRPEEPPRPRTAIGLFKTEAIQRREPWRHGDTVEFATSIRVDWFNTRRVIEPIGYVLPAEYETRYYEQAAAA